MSVASADVQTAVVAAWDAADLDDTFKAFWSAGASSYPALHDTEATPGQPTPYCVMETDASTTTDRMSADAGSLREVRDVPLRFNIQAATVSGDDRSAKGIANHLAEEIMKVFGGHPTESPQTLTLANGRHLWTQFVSDYGVPTEENAYNWIINYLFMVDVPVKT